MWQFNNPRLIRLILINGQIINQLLTVIYSFAMILGERRIYIQLLMRWALELHFTLLGFVTGFYRFGLIRTSV